MNWHIFQEPMQYMFKKIQVRVTGEVKWKKVWPNNTSIQIFCPRVEPVELLKAIRAHTTRVFINPNMPVAEIYNTFPGELGLIGEEDPRWKVGLVNTTVQEPSAEVDSWHKILWTQCLYSLRVVHCWNKKTWRKHKILDVDLYQFGSNGSEKGMAFFLPRQYCTCKWFYLQSAELIILKTSVHNKSTFRRNIMF